MFDWLRNRFTDANDDDANPAHAAQTMTPSNPATAASPASPAAGTPPPSMTPPPVPGPRAPQTAAQRRAAALTRPIQSSMSQFSQAVVQSLPINMMPQPPAGSQPQVIRRWEAKASGSAAAGGTAPAPSAPPAPSGPGGHIRVWRPPTQKHSGQAAVLPGPDLNEPQGTARVWRPPTAPTAPAHPSPSAPSAAPQDARELAQEFLRDQQLMAQLPAEVTRALRGLVGPTPTQQQINDGLAAVAAIVTALQAAHQDALAQPLPTLLREWFLTPTWSASREWLTTHLYQMPYDAAEQFEQLARRVRSGGDPNGADQLESHAKLLREAQRVGVDNAYRALVGAKAFENQPASSAQSTHLALVAAWVKTPTWSASRQYLAAHQRELLVDETEMTLRLLHHDQTDPRAKQQIELHQRIISMARQSGVDAAYRAVIGDEAFQSAPGGAIGGPSPDDLITLDQARDIAQTTLNDVGMARSLAPELRADLEGLLSPYASADQIKRGKRAAVFIAVVEGTQQVRELLVEWMNTPNWQLSYEYLIARQAQLLTDEAEVGLRVLMAAESNPTNQKTISDHQRLLEECRRIDVNAAYAPLLNNRATWT